MLGLLKDMFKMLKITETSFKKTNVQMWQNISRKISLNFGKVLTNYFYYIISEVWDYLEFWCAHHVPPCVPTKLHMILNDAPGVFPSSHKFIKLFPIALYLGQLKIWPFSWRVALASVTRQHYTKALITPRKKT
jgi:hypothetical protein